MNASAAGQNAPIQKLLDCPDWTYCLRDTYEIYRRSSAGGSGKIRAHQRAVREGISGVLKANCEIHTTPPQTKPVVAHLRRALDEGRRERHAGLIRGIEALASQLSWQYGYEKVPRGLERKFD